MQRLLWHVAAPVFCLLWLAENASFQLSAPREVTAANGGSVTIVCEYHQRYRENTKYWCKGKIYLVCKIMVETTMGRRGNRWSEKSYITEDKEAGYFSVTMTSLSESDEDKYWCVIASSGKDIHTGVRLRILPTVTTFIPLTTSSPTTQSEICWWAVLRWIFFILLLCCFAATHIVGRIQTVGQTNRFNFRIPTFKTGLGKTII